MWWLDDVILEQFPALSGGWVGGDRGQQQLGPATPAVGQLVQNRDGLGVVGRGACG
jgi:hypothetical protein